MARSKNKYSFLLQALPVNKVESSLLTGAITVFGYTHPAANHWQGLVSRVQTLVTSITPLEWQLTTMVTSSHLRGAIIVSLCSLPEVNLSAALERKEQIRECFRILGTSALILRAGWLWLMNKIKGFRYFLSL